MGKTILTRRVGLLFVLAIALAALALGASLATTKANALPSFTAPVNGIGPCQTCHTQTSVHGVAAHGSFFANCTQCHVSGDVNTPPTPVACGACHGGVSQILKSASHTTQGCGTTVGCHGYSSPTPTPTPTPVVTPKLTIKTATSVKVKKTLKISGAATPTSLAGSSVKVTVQKKSGAKWKTFKSASAKISATGAYLYKYKAIAKGTFRVHSAVAAKAGVNKAATSVWKTFKVK